MNFQRFFSGELHRGNSGQDADSRRHWSRAGGVVFFVSEKTLWTEIKLSLSTFFVLQKGDAFFFRQISQVRGESDFFGEGGGIDKNSTDFDSLESKDHH